MALGKAVSHAYNGRMITVPEKCYIILLPFAFTSRSPVMKTFFSVVGVVLGGLLILAGCDNLGLTGGEDDALNAPPGLSLIHI